VEEPLRMLMMMKADAVWPLTWWRGSGGSRLEIRTEEGFGFKDSIYMP
jgi:hypothetical protein